MRPKILVTLAVSALALTACTSVPAATEPTPDAANVEVQSVPTGEGKVSAQVEGKAASPEEKFLDSVRKAMAPHDEYFADLSKSIKSEKYWLKVGKQQCKELEAGTLNPAPNAGNALESEYQKLIMSHIYNLCPQS
ncbi:hypothetical protein [Glutamicibacter sp. PS]|uniref:hypothetical protein n=1 Tax=Glutamicibacter sp. PS TaxID=3075634 RepID=UPI002852AD5B|nr:hypothetical protein [Glutamicibacter sp. PS]